ncbi:hypothetical protein [Flavobacterium sp. UMI-01]|uniref:hypothetical protein n=1 Tax=Flavobacterium sp. UMI-01 TaxID=1441053 RepID=UPI002108271A|nr:hypothetical protein [Flavobacterium sp. UMI-01]
MKTFINNSVRFILFATLSVFLISSCSISTRTSTKTQLPPGQAKKIYGGTSAKQYAPGQNK